MHQLHEGKDGNWICSEKRADQGWQDWGEVFFSPLTSDTYLAVNFDLLVCVLVDIADEIVELLHQLEVAEGKFV